MSRSRKKPSYSDYSRNHTCWAKRQASKAVRRYQGELTDGKIYKKVYCSYDIFDYKGAWFHDIPRIGSFLYEYYLASYRK
jgi:hypothetical protein